MMTNVKIKSKSLIAASQLAFSITSLHFKLHFHEKIIPYSWRVHLQEFISPQTQSGKVILRKLQDSQECKKIGICQTVRFCKISETHQPLAAHDQSVVNRRCIHHSTPFSVSMARSQIDKREKQGEMFFRESLE